MKQRWIEAQHKRVKLAQTVWPYIRRILGTPYIRYRIWHWATGSVTVWPYMGFGRPYIYAVCTVNRHKWTVFAGGAGFDSQQQQYFLLFLVNFLFSRLFFLSSSFASLFYWCMCFALRRVYNGGLMVKVNEYWKYLTRMCVYNARLNVRLRKFNRVK